MESHFRINYNGRFEYKMSRQILGLQRTPFPNLGLLGDYIFLYDKENELELQTEEDELWLKEYKKKRRAHIQKIVESSMLTEQEKEWMESTHHSL